MSKIFPFLKSPDDEYNPSLHIGKIVRDWEGSLMIITNIQPASKPKEFYVDGDRNHKGNTFFTGSKYIHSAAKL